MTIGERIKQVRKENKLTQTAFAERVRVSFGSVSKLERGETNPADRTIALICHEFNVSETWLRTGEGEMLAPETESNDHEKLVDSIADEYGLGATDRAILMLYLDMDAKDRDYVNACALSLFREALEQKRGKADAAPLTDAEIAERVAAYESLLKGIQQIERLPDVSTGTPKPASANSGSDCA